MRKKKPRRRGLAGPAQQYTQRARGKAGEHHSDLSAKDEDQGRQEIIATGASHYVPTSLAAGAASAIDPPMAYTTPIEPNDVGTIVE